MSQTSLTKETRCSCFGDSFVYLIFCHPGIFFMCVFYSQRVSPHSYNYPWILFGSPTTPVKHHYAAQWQSLGLESLRHDSIFDKWHCTDCRARGLSLLTPHSAKNTLIMISIDNYYETQYRQPARRQSARQSFQPDQILWFTMLDVNHDESISTVMSRPGSIVAHCRR